MALVVKCECGELEMVEGVEIEGFIGGESVRIRIKYYRQSFEQVKKN